MIYRTYSLDTRNDAIRRALIMVHGTNRNADHYFETSIAAAFLAGALEDTVVIAPHMIDQHRQARGERDRLGEQLAHGRPGAHDTVAVVVRLRRRDPAQAREQDDVPEHESDRRRGAFRRRPVREPVRDVEQDPRHARRADHLRRRQPVELRVAGRRAAARAGRRRSGEGEGGLEPARCDTAAAAHELHVRAVRCVQGADLQPLAVGIRKPDRLQREPDATRS